MNDPTTSVSFTGHRTYRGQVDAALRDTVHSLYAQGFRTFLCGMATGFDLAAGETVIACRAELSDLQLIAVIPFAGQESHFTPLDKSRYARLRTRADGEVILSNSYYPGCYAVRNDYLVAHAAMLVAWYDGSPGGTRYTLHRALQSGRSVVNLHPQIPLVVQPAPTLF